MEDLYPMKQETLSYFDDLNYSVVTQSEDVYELTQNRTGLTVELNFSALGKANCPQKARKKLIRNFILSILMTSKTSVLMHSNLCHQAE